VRSFLCNSVRATLVGFLIAGLVLLPSFAASDAPLGVVVASQHALLDNASAVAGATVYAGDAFATDAQGSLRLKIAESQLYLLSSSGARLAQQDNTVHASVDHGTVGFSTTTPDQIAIDTPLATVRGAAGQRVFGQVAVTGADKMTVSAFEGTLLIAGEDQEQVVKPGESYTVMVAPAAEPGGQDPQGAVQHKKKRRLIFALIAGGTLATIGIITWEEKTESCSKLPCSSQ